MLILSLIMDKNCTAFNPEINFYVFCVMSYSHIARMYFLLLTINKK